MREFISKSKGILLFIFVGISTWLSLDVRNQKKENHRLVLANNSLVGERNDLITRHGIVYYVLSLNLAREQTVLADSYFPFLRDNKPRQLVYFKEYACNPCIEQVIITFLEKSSANPSIHFFAHETNRDYFYDLSSKNQEIDITRIFWLSGNLYEGAISPHDAELLLLDHQNRITGIIPLEYLKIEGLLDGMVDGMMG